jgi:hypothetical protein
VLSGVSSPPSSFFVALLISRVQPPAFVIFGSFVWYPCSCDTKSLDSLNLFGFDFWSLVFLPTPTYMQLHIYVQLHTYVPNTNNYKLSYKLTYKFFKMSTYIQLHMKYAIAYEKITLVQSHIPAFQLHSCMQLHIVRTT